MGQVAAKPSTPAFVLVCALHVSLLFSLFLSAAQAQTCRDIFSPASVIASRLDGSQLTAEAAKNVELVPEFRFIRQAAEERGLRVWLFGGTAASYLHYVKWDLLRRSGEMHLQAERFDYDYTNIFRSTQDLDIVVDTTPEVAKEFEKLLKKTFPHFLGSKDNKWEVRSLNHTRGRAGEFGYKEALLNDSDFALQNTDSNSLGMVELTRSLEPSVRDLKSWDDLTGRSQFLEDTLNHEITYFRNPRHFETARARLGENPEILSVIRVLVKAFQYELQLSPASEAEIRKVIREFKPHEITNSVALRRIQDTSIKLIKHAANLEHAINKLDALGLRKKLISLGDTSQKDSFAWWLNKEPLKSRPIGRGSGLTARKLGIEIVAHETGTFLAYESITRAHSGEPNVLISRNDYPGENAAHGNGFYTKIGLKGARNTGLTIRFRLNPDAREGKDADFTREGDFIIIHNKAALEVIPESLHLDLNTLLKIARGEVGFSIDPSEKALLEKLKRRLTFTKIKDELGQLYPNLNRKDVGGLVKTVISLNRSTVASLLSERVLENLNSYALMRSRQILKPGDENSLAAFITQTGSLLAVSKAPNSSDRDGFKDLLVRSVRDQKHSLKLKILALEELQLIDEAKAEQESKLLSSEERIQFLSKLKTWTKSSDFRKREFVVRKNDEVARLIQVNAPINQIKAHMEDLFFDINHVESKSRSPLLHLAAKTLNPEIFQELWQNPKLNRFAKDEDGNTVLHVLAGQEYFGYPRQNEKLQIFDLIRSQMQIDFNSQNSSGKTALHRAIKTTNDQELVRRLLQDSSVNPNLVDKSGLSPIQDAIKFSRTDIIKILLSTKNFDQSLLRGEKAFELLKLAMETAAYNPGREPKEILHLLFDQLEIDLRQKDQEGRSVLTAALGYRQKEIAERVLLEPGFLTTKLKKSDQIDFSNAIFWSIYNRYEAVTLKLLTKPDLDINQTGTDKPHPLMLIRHFSLPVLDAVLKMPGINVNYKSRSGETPIFALKMAEPEVIKRFLNDPRVKLSEWDSEGKTWLHRISPHEFADMAQALKSSPRVDFNILDKNGDTILLAYLRELKTHAWDDALVKDQVQELLSLPLDRNIRGQDGLTALELMYTIAPQSKTAQLLIEDHVKNLKRKNKKSLGPVPRRKLEKQLRLDLERRFGEPKDVS